VTVIPRDYQREAHEAVRKAWADGVQRPAVVLPTGAGKTVVIADVTTTELAERDKGLAVGRVLVLAHRDELLRQAMNKIRDVAPGLRVGVVKGTEDGVGAPVVVASVPTLRHEARRARVRGVGLVIVDECHHATAASYLSILNHYGCFDAGGARALGFTATMSRGDGVGLGEVWQEVVYQRDIKYMITRGFLVKPRGVYVRVEDLDLSKVRKSGGDYSEGQLGEALAASMAPERIVDAYREHALGRSTLVFVPTVEFAHLMAQRFTDAGVTARVVSGAQPEDECRRYIAEFRAGKVSVLINCMKLTEGTDLPIASCVVIARPTMHAGLYIQMVGRVLRTHPGKTDALVLDVVGASKRHALAGLVDLIGERSVEEDGSDDEDKPERELLDDEERGEDYGERAWLDGLLVAEDVDLFHGQQARWQRTYGGHWFVAAPGDRFITVIPSLSGGDDWDVISVHRSYIGESDWIAQGVSEIGYAMAHGEGVISQDLGYAKRQATWRKKPASEAQRWRVRRNGLVLPEGASSGEASDLINIAEASRRLDPYVPAAR